MFTVLSRYLPAIIGLYLIGAPMANGAVGCSTQECHLGIANIKPDDHEMMRTIKMIGSHHGDPDGCVMCHGGNPKAVTKEEAHKGIPPTLRIAPGPKDYYPDPGSIWIADNSCGACHPGYVYRSKLGLMNTEAGKIQGNLVTWGFAEVQDYNVPWGNYDTEDIDSSVPFSGTPTYQSYMKQQIAMYPKQYPESLKMLPQVTMDQVNADPKQAGITYQRHDCNRCHIGVRGREERGDFRGMGCSSCHVLYGTDGYYMGDDKTISKDKPGHMLRHEIVATRKTGGIPVEACSSCHNRGKRIGVSFQGLMEFPYGSPFNEEGNKQPKLHTKRYLFISDDLHHQQQSRKGNPKGGMLCQDCHTSIDMHGDGNIHGTTLAQVEIECSDCHGLTNKYPWELPVGYGDEFGKDLNKDGRGVATERLIPGRQFGFPYEAEDGFILTARGNPFGNVIKRENKVIVHSATGNDFEVPVLKGLRDENKWKDPSAEVAMNSVAKHMDKLECYSCHASWAPQCYGCHVKVDYTPKDGKPVTGTDWIASGNDQKTNGQTAESVLGSGGLKSPGKISETRSYLRWEDPVLGISGEGRVSPLIPGCQVTYTIINDKGEPLLNNEIALNITEGKELGQQPAPLAIDMAPVQPHTAQRKARTCESCHTNPKVAGLGIGNGTFGNRQGENIVMDLMDATTREIIPAKYSVQIPAIPKLTFDWSQIVDRDGKQLATVGTHWPMSRAFNKQEIDNFMRAGTCMGCHQNMSEAELWKKVSTEGTIDPIAHLEAMNKIIKFMAEQGAKPAEINN
ncbi:cytochrome C [Desulforhopalus sp. 52FAK]